ncbi:MAG: type IV toxin-antitoxin system AbiEi family antitoxin domain-containing protein, partial [Lachnospiraceae bacterium]|nr:type IV toxin-antitoxin system AbiEi family antitoxin domain-containing protein [Lachnospiraceae bacterium]
AKTAELLSAGLSKSDIGRLTNSGVIVRIRHGFYRLRSGRHLPEALKHTPGRDEFRVPTR